MKSIKATFLALCSASMLGLFSCGPDDTPEPKDYQINDFIFNTFLFAQGTWWAFYDSNTAEYDTLRVTFNVGQHQNVYEGSTFKYSRYYYRADWIWSKTSKRYMVEYSSDQHSTWKGIKLPQISMDGLGNTYGTGYGKLYFHGMPLNDTITAGYAIINGNTVGGRYSLLQKGDSLFYQSKWNVDPFVKFKLIKSVAHELQNITMTFQAHNGLIEHTIDGNYKLVDKNIIPMIR